MTIAKGSLPGARPSRASREGGDFDFLSFLDLYAEIKVCLCHAERSSEESEPILTAKSKHPYLLQTAEVDGTLTLPSQ
jgi:hypothetical protein